mgnify:CR=1 FL=1
MKQTNCEIISGLLDFFGAEEWYTAFQAPELGVSSITLKSNTEALMVIDGELISIKTMSIGGDVYYHVIGLKVLFSCQSLSTLCKLLKNV